MDIEEPFLKDVEIVAEPLKGAIKLQTVRNWRSMNPPKGPPFYRIGKNVFYRESEVKEWLNSQKVLTGGVK